VYATQRACAFLRANQPWRQLELDGNIVLHALAPGQPLQLSPRLSVTSCLVPHRGEHSDTVAYHAAGPARRLFYCPDIDRCGPGRGGAGRFSCGPRWDGSAPRPPCTPRTPLGPLAVAGALQPPAVPMGTRPV
jgi:hypothetical protein